VSEVFVGVSVRNLHVELFCFVFCFGFPSEFHWIEQKVQALPRAVPAALQLARRGPEPAVPNVDQEQKVRPHVFAAADQDRRLRLQAMNVNVNVDAVALPVLAPVPVAVERVHVPVRAVEMENVPPLAIGADAAAAALAMLRAHGSPVALAMPAAEDDPRARAQPNEGTPL
jgi:hypothetical protein